MRKKVLISFALLLFVSVLFSSTGSAKTVTVSKIEKIKIMFEIDNTYQQAQSLAHMFGDLQHTVHLATDEYDLKGTYKSLDDAYYYYNTYKGFYKDLQTRVKKLKAKTKSKGMYNKADFDLFNKYFEEMNDGIVYFDRSSTFLKEFFQTGDHKMFMGYLEEGRFYNNLFISSQKNAGKGVSKYNKAILNFK